MTYTYSRWEGGQDATFDPDEIIAALSDDLMSDGDLRNALQRLMRWGMPTEGDQRIPGLQNLLQRLRAQRQQELDRYNLESVLSQIREQLDEIVGAERAGIDRKIGEMSDGPDDLREMLEGIGEKKRSFLDQLPQESGVAMTALADYEFFDDTAREKFEALANDLQQRVLQAHFQHLQETLNELGHNPASGLKTMIKDLNRMLDAYMDGQELDMEPFMQQHGRHFPGVETFDQLLQQLADQSARAESLLRSMPPDMRSELERLMQAALQDIELRDGLARMAEMIEAVRPPGGGEYVFGGEQSLTLQEALDLMKHLQNLEALERDLKAAQDSGDLHRVDGDDVRQLMGEEAFHAVERLKQLTEVLEQAGYVEGRNGSFELTARGIRRIGQKALEDIFDHLKRDTFGRHPVPVRGHGGDRSDETKGFEHGDPFLLDMNRTLMNAMFRTGARHPLELALSDFEVFRTESVSQASTVLMLDMSRSMPLRGCFVAAKKVALALNSLIRTQFPRDHLYVVGFSDFARELRPETLHQLTWGDYVYGTNMQHGFVLARRLLGRHKSSNKQIILITDGEPTAHFDGGEVHFSYPPTFRTIQETLREVMRCTREDIVINTFMLERSHYLADFVNQMTRINRGRAFFATPERLGDYIVVDYVNQKSKSL